jgi:hypothetical protein
MYFNLTYFVYYVDCSPIANACNREELKINKQKPKEGNMLESNNNGKITGLCKGNSPL